MRALILALVLVTPGVGPSKYCYFLLDYSGSMTDEEKVKMINFFKYSIEHYTDDGYIKLGVFNNEVFIYSEEWIKMPDGHEYKNMLKWLKSVESSGSTNISKAICIALKEKVDELTVFTITDGRHNTGEWKVGKAQTKRNYSAPLIFLGFDVEGGDKAKLIKLSKKYGGKFVMEETK